MLAIIGPRLPRTVRWPWGPNRVVAARDEPRVSERWARAPRPELDKLFAGLLGDRSGDRLEESHLFEPFEIRDADRYDIQVVGVPVHDPDDGGASLMIRLAQLPHGVSRAQVKEWIEAMKSAAGRVSDQVANSHRKQFEDYRLSVARIAK